MTNTEPEKHQTSNEGDLPVVLLHGTSGQSEDWSQVVEQLTRHRPVIRLNYAEPVTGTDSANVPAVSDFADRVVAAARAGGGNRFYLFGFSLGAPVSPFIAPQYPYMLPSLLLLSGFASRACPPLR